MEKMRPIGFIWGYLCDCAGWPSGPNTLSLGSKSSVLPCKRSDFGSAIHSARQSLAGRLHTEVEAALQAELNQELERTSFIQSVCNLTETGGGEFLARLGELRGIQKVHRLGAEC